MRTLGSFALGFVVGIVLLLWATLLAGAGHGTLAPLASVAPELLLVFAAVEKSEWWGFWLVMVPGTGLLWGFYFGLLPTITSFFVRMLIVTIVCLVHFGAGVFMLSKDVGFDQQFQRSPVLIVGYFIFFWIVLLLLGALTWAGSKRRVSTESS